MVVIMVTTKLTDELHTNFTSDCLNQYEAFKDGDIVKIIATLFRIEHVVLLENPVASKLKILSRIKVTAGEFYKRGNQVKAVKIYRKIHGYFNFGDAANNSLREDEASEDLKQSTEQFNALKLDLTNDMIY